MAPALSRLPIQPVAAALLLAAGLFGTADPARAACGSYVVIDGRPADHPVEPARGPAEPCRGPNCSAKQAPVPAPLAPPVNPLPAPKDRCVGDVTLAPPAVGFDTPGDLVSGRPVRRSFPPFHPPRSAG
jgi:hypothetical protein